MPKFIDRVATAFVAACIAFIPGFAITLIWGLSPGSYDVHPLAAVGRTLDSMGLCLAVIFIAIFLFAYPVERWMVKPEHNRWVAGTKYLIVFGSLAGLSLILGLGRMLFSGPQPGFDNFTYLLTILTVAAPVAGACAFVGRALYPSLLSARKAMVASASALLVLMLIPLAVPRFDDFSPVYEANSANSFYPPELAQELSRGTWDVDEETNAAGTHQTVSGLLSDPTLKYRLTWNCRTVSHQEFTILAQDQATGKTIFERSQSCNSPEPKFLHIDLGDAPIKVELLIFPADRATVSDQPIDYESSDAFVILAPETSNLPANY
jgi:hypothetical protein